MTSVERMTHSVGAPPLRLALWLVAAAAGLGAPDVVAAGPDQTKLVVVVYPHESDGAPGTVLVNRGIRAAFAGQPVGPVDVRNEYVDTSRLRDAEFMRTQTAMLRQKYAGRRIDLVIAVLSPGLDFVLAVRDEVFPCVPVVDVLVDRREVVARRLPADVTGIPVRMDLAGTLDIALRLHPDTRRVFVVAGSSAFDTHWAAEAGREFRPFAERVEVEYLTGLPMDDLLDRVANLPDRSLIYYLHVFKDGAGKDFIPGEVIEQLAARANAPVYTHVDTFVDRGAVGGRVFTHEAEGRAAARVGLRILSGEAPQSIPVGRESESIYVFNARQLRRWGVREASLPPGSEVRFREPTFWDTYRWQFIGTVTLIAVEGLLIVVLLVSRGTRRRSEAALRESEAWFRLIADAAPILIWTSGTDKRCTYINRPWLEFTGRPLERELGDGWAEGVHPDDVRRCLEVYSTSFDKRVPFEMVYRLRRHDGEYRWVVDRGLPRLAVDGAFGGYVGACTDITDRRRAEDGLRASQRELQSLAGQLIAAQEAERRRIARELHDDINQRLALLSVELDLVARRPPALPAEVKLRLRGLSDQVRELSTAVHDLSHQLHPTKLEQLGLVASVRGLCNELSLYHGLEITFIHHNLPAVLPEATALCMYRIAQEALHNVVRHGRTDRARVELTRSAEAIRMLIGDDGVGFDPATTGRAGLGLVSMRERLSLVGGQITIDSRPGGGTRIDVRVPLSDTGEAAGGTTDIPPPEDELIAVGPSSEESP